MTTRQTRQTPDSSRKADHTSNRKSIPASEVGVTLKVSNEALKKLDKMQEESFRNAQLNHKFSWR